MLRITIHKSPGAVTFQLEGRLAGPWVQELAACWRATLDQSAGPIVRVDLVAVTFVDGAGRELLTAMYHRGAKLVAADCLMHAVVAEVVGRGESGERVGDVEEVWHRSIEPPQQSTKENHL